MLMSFGKNYVNAVITGILRGVLWNSPTLHPKLGAVPDIPIRTDKHPSMLGKQAKNTIDNNWGFC
jgi:hypothetical protein